jgi:AcrR family transcriptional regulator
VSAAASGPIPLSARKRTATRDRIAAAAAALVTANGLAATTVERIAERADVGRATFFRYFSSKEDAVADGISRQWLGHITAALARQPPSLSAQDAVVAAFADLGDGFTAISDQVRELAVLTRSSPVLSAWTQQTYLGYESAIAELIAPRLSCPAPQRPRSSPASSAEPRLSCPAPQRPRASPASSAEPRLNAAADDPRPRLIGALAMASLRIALDDWLQHGGSLPDRLQAALSALVIR